MEQRIKPLLINEYECRLDKALHDIEAMKGCRILAKCRLEDVLVLRPADFKASADEQYARGTHFDFVVAEGESALPLFAIEFDEAGHRSSIARRRRDAIKSELCVTKGLPLLRVESTLLSTQIGRFAMLNWIIDSWFRDRAIGEAQANGSLPEDEPFSPCDIVLAVEGNAIVWNDPRVALWARFQHLFECGRLAWLNPQVIVWSDSTDTVVKALVITRLSRAQAASPWLAACVKCSSYHFWPGSDSIVAETLALSQVLSLADGVLEGKRRAMTDLKVARFLERCHVPGMKVQVVDGSLSWSVHFQPGNGLRSSSG